MMEKRRQRDKRTAFTLCNLLCRSAEHHLSNYYMIKIKLGTVIALILWRIEFDFGAHLHTLSYLHSYQIRININYPAIFA